MIFQRTLIYFFFLYIVLSSFIICQANRNNTCNVITVVGSSVVTGTPDVAIASVSVSSFANTSSAALNDLNSKTRQLLQLFNQYNIPLSYVQTTSLSLYPQYSYLTGQQILVSQKAGQVFSLKLSNISSGNYIGSLVDAITAINGTVVSRLVFDISNKSQIIRLASTNAWNDAYNKAYQYAGLAAGSIGRAFAIRIPSQPPYVSQVYNDLITSSNDIAVGNFGISASIQVDFLINS